MASWLTRRERESSLTPLLKEMDRMLSEWNWPRTFDVEKATPPIEVTESDNDIVVRAQVPGMKKEDLQVEILDGSLNLRGEVRETKEEKEKSFYRSEFHYGSFSRTVPLPSGVDTAKATAKLTEGVLELRIPKTDEARKRTRRIQIA